MATLSASVDPLRTATETWSTLIMRLPEGFRPPLDLTFTAAVFSIYWEQCAPCTFTVKATGDVTLDYRVGFTPDVIHLGASFPVA